MATAFQIASSAAGVAIAASSTNFSHCATGGLVVNAAEADSLIKYRTAGTITNLRCRIIAGNRTADHVVILRNAGTDVGGNDIAYTATPGEFEDATGTNAIAATDTVSYRLKSGGSGNTNYSFTYVGCNWSATNDTTCHYAATGSLAHSAVSETSYRIPGSGAAKTTTQANGEWRVKLPSGISKPIFKNLYVRLSANTSTNTSTIAVAGLTGTGGNNTAPTVTVAAGGGATVLEDSTNSKDATDADQVSFKCVGGATVAFTVQTCAIEVSTGGDGVFWFVAGNVAGLALSTTNSKMPIGGSLTSTTTEGNVQAKFGIASCTLSLLAVQVSSAGAGSTLRLRAGAADAGTPAAVGITTTAGWVVDATNTYSAASTDEVNYNWVKSANATVTCVALAVSNGAQTKSDSETGSGADAGESVAASPSDSDTGSGADAGEALSPTDSDTGSGTDAGEALAVSGVSDTGSGTDAGETFDRYQAEYGGGGFRPADTGALETPSVAALNIAGDLDLRLYMIGGNADATGTSQTVWWSGGGALVAKDGGSGNASYGLMISPDSTIEWWSTSDGTGATKFTRSSSVPVPFRPGEPGWLRVTFRPVYLVTDHEVKFYTSTDYDPLTGSGTWTQLGVAWSNAAGTDGLFTEPPTYASTAPLSVGGPSTVSPSTPLQAYPVEEAVILYLELRDGIAGTIVSSADFRDSAGSTVLDNQGRTWTPIDNFGGAYNGLNPAVDSPTPSIAATLTDAETGTGTDAGENVDVIGGETPISDSETSSGLDAGESISATTSDTETGSGADAGESVAADTSDTETGSGLDAEALIDLSGEGDTSSSTDDGSIAATLSDAETGAGVDAGEAIAAETSDTETGTGTDAGEAVAAGVSDSDTGSGLDAGESFAAALDDTETGSGLDAEALVDLSGEGENSTGTDDGSIAASLTDADTATGADAGETADAALDDSETGSGFDAGEALAAALTDTDLGTGLDAGESLAVDTADTETGNAVDDDESVAAALDDTETGTGVDAGESFAIAADDTDTATGVDAEALIDLSGEGDTSSTTDNGAIAATLSDADTGTGLDAGENVDAAAPITDTETGSGDDNGENIDVLPGPTPSGIHGGETVPFRPPARRAPRPLHVRYETAASLDLEVLTHATASKIGQAEAHLEIGVDLRAGGGNRVAPIGAHLDVAVTPQTANAHRVPIADDEIIIAVAAAMMFGE